MGDAGSCWSAASVGVKRNLGSEATGARAGAGAGLVWVLEDFIFTPETKRYMERKEREKRKTTKSMRETRDRAAGE